MMFLMGRYAAVRIYLFTIFLFYFKNLIINILDY